MVTQSNLRREPKLLLSAKVLEQDHLQQSRGIKMTKKCWRVGALQTVIQRIQEMEDYGIQPADWSFNHTGVSMGRICVARQRH